MMNLISNLLLVLTAFVSRGDMTPQDYFDIWNSSGALGMHFEIDDYDLIFGKDERALLHEVGHTLPIPLEFYVTVGLYVEDCEGGFCDYARMYFELGRYHEVYAELYMMNILEDIPQIFEEFYGS